MHNVNRQKTFLQKYLSKESESARQTNDGSLDDEDFKKITGYYGLAVPAILGEALCALRGFKMTLPERMALTYQGAMTGLFDDFFDKEKISDETVKVFMEKPAEISGINSRQKLFLQFYKKALHYANNPALMLHYLQKVYEAQIESKKQSSPGSLTKEEIKRITLNKGGVSVLFYRSVLSNALFKEEEDALYQMGGLMQFGNDIFDVYKDSVSHIDTLMTTTKKVNDVRTMFNQITESSFSSFSQTKYADKNIRKFQRLIFMSLCSRCFVCLDQLESKEKKSDNIFSPQLYSREDLVCDMDTFRNKRRSMIYFIRRRSK